MFHNKSKHIEIKYHYIMDMVQRGAVKLQYVTSTCDQFCHGKNVAIEEQIADVVTKPLARVKFDYFKERLGVIQIEIPRKRE